MRKTELNMLDFMRQIRDWVFPQVPLDQSRKRKSIMEEIEASCSPKLRRVSNMSHANEEDWLSSSSRGSFRHTANINDRIRLNRSKENVVINIDDDEDDIMVVPINSNPKWSSILQRNKDFSTCTSTPFRSKYHQRDDDVVFVKSDNSAMEKSRLADRRGFEYIKPLSHLSNGRQGKIPNDPPFVFNNTRDVKAKLQRQPVRSSSVLNQSIRLDEKLRFRELITQTAPNYSSQLMQKNLNSFSKYSTPLSNVNSSRRGRKMVEMVTPLKKSSMEFVDLTKRTKPRLNTKDEIQRVLDDFDSDSDVEIMPCPPSPKPDIHVEAVNSLKPIIDTSKNTRKDWLTDIIRKHRENIAVRTEQIKQQQAQRQNLRGISKEVHSKLLTDQFQKCLKLREDVLPVEIDDGLKLPEISEADQKRIDIALMRSKNPGEVLVEKFNLNITRRDMQTLAGLNWLNDEVINFYMNLIMERGKMGQFPTVYTMNTFFYPKLLKDGHASLRRWTRRVDIFAHDLICIPIHLSVHWCMAVIDFRKKRISYYDSMGSPNRKCLDMLMDYLEAEYKDKKKDTFDTDGWELLNAADIPQQMNGSDCGMFACTFAEFLTRDAKLNFLQEDMPYLRKKMVLEILNGNLLINN